VISYSCGRHYQAGNVACDCYIACDCDLGMFQRLDRMRKHAFGSMIVFGENNNNSIGGLWMWRGHELAFTVSPISTL